MLYCSIDKKEWNEKHLSLIEKEDIYDDEEGEYGLCKEPHITLLWGIHPDEVDVDLAKNIIKSIGSMEIETDKISIFENPDFDVVKYEIEPTERLLQIRNILSKTLPNTQTYPEYKPHITLSYVKKGKGKKYKEKLKKPIKFILDKAVYSGSDYNKDRFKLKPLMESMAGTFYDIQGAVDLYKKNVKKSKKPLKSLRDFVGKEFGKIKSFNDFNKKEK
jgi:2'-5' RNA ligase